MIAYSNIKFANLHGHHLFINHQTELLIEISQYSILIVIITIRIKYEYLHT